ncbi:hypothetical protein LOTGIDRAFT_157978 [Lottia gigantea]|uniref:Expansin-like EG45 domain-containing protein n=1 Tax=Lottia gigantea TaxID=225164 RepID=V4ATR2_LOTGI|nr:hypothetical protein LOTGIDRAFT_157978 [Lottia gigantea]ESP00688.1 hypothetical protein LOTGIDRAFT_157978 [Lottia gigantea]
MMFQFNLIVGLVYSVVVQAAIKDDIIHMYKNKFNGDGTYYGPTDGGTCQYDPPSKPPAGLNPIIRNFVALNKPQFLGSYSCGMCFKVNSNGQGLGTNPIKGHFVVFVADLCPECKTGSLDFAINGDGRWKIEIQAVQCPVGNTKLEYKFQGSNSYYIKLQIRNARIPAVAVKIKQNGSWKAMSHSADGFWILSDQKPVPTHNIDVQITAANGETVHDTIPELVNAKVLHGSQKVQFALDGNLPTA